MNTSIRLHAAAVIAVTALAATACTASTGHPHGARHLHVTSAAPVPRAPAPLPLPVSAAGLRAAAVVAARFAAAYQTRLADETPSQWLAQLSPMAAGPLNAALARVAATRALWPPRQTVTASAVAEAIRVLASGSVILTVVIRQASPAGGGAATVSLAVTVIRAGGGWAVYDVEPASAGNSG